MSNKGNIIYKIIASITLFVPLPLYLFLSATLFNITPDYTMDNVEFNEVIYDDGFLYTTNNEAIYDGVVVSQDGLYGFIIDEEDIVEIDNHYYSLKDGVLTDIKKLEVQKELSYKLPLVFFISLLGVLIVVLIVNKKMQWHLKYPRLAVLVALLTATVILYILSTVLSNILIVFMIATASWAVYLLEYYARKGVIDKDKADKEESDLKSALRKALE